MKLKNIQEYYLQLLSCCSQAETRQNYLQSLVYVQFLQQGQLVYRIIDYDTLMTILEDPVLYQDFVLSITKLFDCFPN